MGNKYFVGQSIEISHRLPDVWLLAALKLLDEALAGNRAVSGKVFENEFCRPMSIAYNWHRFICNKFGQAVAKLPVTQRVMRVLTTDGWIMLHVSLAAFLCVNS